MGKESPTYQATVVVCSDTCSKDASLDESGDYVFERLRGTGLFLHVDKLIVEDDKRTITRTVKQALDKQDNVLIITVGGTGFCPRDVTPEATSVLYEKPCQSVVTALLMSCLRYTPRAALSRITAGITGNCFIVNFPGSPRACLQMFDCLNQTLEHILEQVQFDPDLVRASHREDVSESTIATSDSSTSVLELRNMEQGVVDEKESVKQITSSIESTTDTSLLKQFFSSTNLDVSLDADSFIGEKSNIAVCPGDPSQTVVSPIVNPLIAPLPDTRPMESESPYPLLSYDDGLNILSECSKDLFSDKQKVELKMNENTNTIIGDILAETIKTGHLIPPHPVSTMDGYVINVPLTLSKMISSITNIKAKLVSFEEFMSLDTNQSGFYCYQVNTGGRVPNENFAVVPVENTTSNMDGTVIFNTGIQVNKYIRSAGSDVDDSDCLPVGSIISPIELSLILSMGARQVEVFKKPSLGVLSTGDELVEFNVTKTQQPGVVDTNGPMLHSLFKTLGYMVSYRGIVGDKRDDLLLNINTSLLTCDVLIITGGASMGSKDHVKDVIKNIGGVIRFGKLNIKPGKPVAFATVKIRDSTKFIFSLPGNPVSAYITSITVVLPFLRKGSRRLIDPEKLLTLDDVGGLINVKISAILDGDSYEFDGRLEFVRAKIISADPIDTSICSVEVSVRQQSSRIMSLKGVDCLIVVHPYMKGKKLAIGQTYQALRLRL